MNQQEKFKKFLADLHESVPSDADKKLLEAVTEAFTLLEANPYIFAGKKPDPVQRRAIGQKMTPQSEEEISAANAERDRKEKLARQAGGRLQGVKTQLLKAAQVAPMEIEEFMRSSELRDAIKAGKSELDKRFGTETSKRSFLDRLKGAARGFTEAEEEFIGELEDED